MAYGIIIQKSNGFYYSFVMYDDEFYDSMKENLGEYRIEFIAGKKGISGKGIHDLANGVDNLIKKLNNVRLNNNDLRDLNLEKELENIFT